MNKPADPVAVLRDLRIGVEMDLGYCPEGKAKLAALDAALSAMEDARRYRWLRDEGDPDSPSGIAVSVDAWGAWGRHPTTYPNGSDLDTLIDAAMAQDGGEGHANR